MKVQLFVPCFIDQLFPQTAVNTVKILRKVGCEVLYNPKQTCCGQPAYNTGLVDIARPVCEKFLADMAGDCPIVVPSASCVGFVGNYYKKVFAETDYPRVYEEVANRLYELSDFLVNYLGITSVGGSLEGEAVYHDSCAGLRECGLRDEPRVLLRNVKGLRLREMADSETCCGFGGTFAINFETISTGMAATKMSHITASNADFVVSTDASCLLHLGSYAEKIGSRVRFLHLADVLANGI
jgi:L-lactate dehydrogenase complex protein LldE